MSTLLVIFFLSFTLAFSDETFQCPDMVDKSCFCYPDVDESLQIYCKTNSSTEASHYLKIQQNIQVIVQCTNSPSWSDFLFGSKVENASPSRLHFVGCVPPGKIHSQRFKQQLDISEVQSLKFSNLKGSLTPDDLQGFPKTTQLILSNNNLGNVDAEVLRGLPELEVLELRETQIQIPTNFFKQSGKLKKLDLSSNAFETLQPKIFDGLEKIEFLNLGRNGINELHPALFSNMKTLVSLDIHHNHLNTLPPDVFENLENLEEINMSSNNFSSLPDGLLQSSHKLEIFKMIYNRVNLTNLPSRLLADKPYLKRVSLLRSSLLNLPKDLLWNSTGLYDVTLDHNYLKTLPKDIFRDAVRMTKLSLAYNDITELPDSIFVSNENLERIDLSHNKIKSINELTFVGLKNLKELMIENNALTSIHAQAFKFLVHLKIANFKNNQLENNLENTSTSPFYTCDQLKELDLSHNKFKLMMNWTRSNNLEKLDLSHNMITSVSAENFQFKSQLVKLDLSNNNISEINLDSLEKLFSYKSDKLYGKLSEHDPIVKVKLSFNPLDCDCKIYNLLRYAKNLMHPHIRQRVQLDIWTMKCASPSEYVLSSPAIIDPQEFNCLDSELNNRSEQEDPCRDSGPCDCYVRAQEQTLFVDCKERDLIEAPRTINPMNMSRVILDLEGNQLELAPDMNNPGYELVTIMNLANNKINFIKADLVTPNLVELNLGNNQVKMLDQATILALEKTDLRLELDGNPWKCECGDDSQFNIFSCMYVKKNNNEFVTCCNSNDEIWLYLILKITVISMLGFLLPIAIIYLYNTRSIKKARSKKKIYDAFVSYSEKDEDFVLKELVSKLQDEPRPYKLCLGLRDWLGGDWIPTRIEKSVEESRCTIVVISANFLKNEWSSFEFNNAYKRAFKDRRTRVIFILYGNIGPASNLDSNLPEYLLSHKYVVWGDPWFWEKLRNEMPPASENHNRNQNAPLIKDKSENKKTTYSVEKEKDRGLSEFIYSISKNVGKNLKKSSSFQTIEDNKLNEFI